MATAQPVVFVRRRVPRDQLAAAIGEGLGQSFGYAGKVGAAVAGPPFTRYTDMSDGQMTIEAGAPLTAAVPGAGEVTAGELAGGPVLVALHAGAYDTLADTYRAMERWMAEHGRRPAGAPWEPDLTDLDPTRQPGRLAHRGLLADGRIADRRHPGDPSRRAAARSTIHRARRCLATAGLAGDRRPAGLRAPRPAPRPCRRPSPARSCGAPPPAPAASG
ncbi:MAG: GyrI-like domain-containing protein [Vicinamibacterales bacterium]